MSLLSSLLDHMPPAIAGADSTNLRSRLEPRPRLVLAVIVVIAATAGLLMDQLTGSEWGIAVGAAMWWTTAVNAAARESKEAL